MIDWFYFLQNCLPKQKLSQWLGQLANLQRPQCLKNFAIRQFIQHYRVNMQEAQYEAPEAYPTFNAFFTRALKSGTRTLAKHPDHLLSPVDGCISQCGPIQNSRLIQAKNQSYTLSHLLLQPQESALLNQLDKGFFATLYLAPKDYHRVHMPYEGTLQSTHYVPGDLFSVNPKSVEQIPHLFARNERLICVFETKRGPMVIVFVGAMIVASIHTVWAGVVNAKREACVRHTDWHAQHLHYAQGDEIGHFALGSTIIMCFSPTFNASSWKTPGSSIVLGETLATSILKNDKME